MKKFTASILALILVMSLAACEGKTASTPESVTEASVETPASTESVEESVEEVENTEEAEGEFLSYADYVAADLDTEVNVKVYVQDHQSWWNDQITVYAADEDGAYFLYNLACSEEDAEKLVPGTEILVNGVKSEWSGEVEIVDGTFEFGSDKTYVATAVDVTSALGTDSLADYMNQKVIFTDMTVEAVSYKNNEPGDDIYVTLSKDGNNYEFCLEYYLNGSDEEFYNLVGNLEAGATVDVEAYLYYYEGPDGHLTSVTVK